MIENVAGTVFWVAQILRKNPQNPLAIRASYFLTSPKGKKTSSQTTLLPVVCLDSMNKNAIRIPLENPEIQSKLKKIGILILDVDGVMTDGRIFWLESFGWVRQFHVKDGYGLKILMMAGIQVAVISGGDSVDVRKRMEFLKINHVFLGDENKLSALDKICGATRLDLEAMAFIGDDLFDIPVMKKVGFSATVPHAVEEVHQVAHYVTKCRGGFGAVREISDAIRKAQNLGPHF